MEHFKKQNISQTVQKKYVLTVATNVRTRMTRNTLHMQTNLNF